MKKILTLLCFLPALALAQSYPSPTYNILTLQTPLAVTNGGSGLATLPAGAVLVGNGASSVGSAAPGTTAQALISNGTGVSPSFQALTSPFVNYTQGGTGAITQTAQNRLRNTVVAGDYGVVSDGATDDSAAINTALASGSVIFPRRATVSNTFTNQTSYTWSSFGGSFTGINPLDKNFPAFGGGSFRSVSSGPQNAIIGIAYNNLPPNTAAFPTGVTGYAQLAAGSGGSSVFGIFGRADLRDTGVATNEFNAFNFSAAPQSALPPNRGFATGLTTPVIMTVASGGTFPTSIGIELAEEGSTPQTMLTGIYTDPNAITGNGIIIGANTTQGPNTSAEFQNVGSGVNLNLTTTGTAAGSNAVLQVLNSSRAVQAFLTQNGSATFNGNLTIGGTITPNQTSGIVGTTTNNNANAGSVGEYLTNTTNTTSMTTATPMNATTQSLTAGDWDVQCSASFNPAAGTTVSQIALGVNTTSATLPGLGAWTLNQDSQLSGLQQVIASPVVRESLTTTTSVYCVAQSIFATSTMTVSGFIRARRVR